MFKKFGYTLAEVLIVLALLGIIAAILLPAIVSVRPNRDKSMFRKAYYVAERVIYEMINDEDLYETAAGTKFGLDNTGTISYNGETFGNETDTSDAAKQKFCKLFSKKVNIVENTDRCIANNAQPPSSYVFEEDDEYKNHTSFITTDGVAWYMPITNFAATGTGANKTPATASIYVDINGDKSPNCQYDENDSTACRKPDIYQIFVQSDGKMYVSGTKEKEFLQGNTNMR